MEQHPPGLLRSFFLHFLLNIAPLGPTSSLHHALMHVHVQSSSRQQHGSNHIFGKTDTSTDTSDYNHSRLCAMLSSHYFCHFCLYFLHLLYEITVGQNRFNEWGALLFAEEIRALLRVQEEVLEVISTEEEEGEDGDGGVSSRFVLFCGTQVAASFLNLNIVHLFLLLTLCCQC